MKKHQKKTKKPKINPSLIAGLVIALLLIGTGLYYGIVYEKYGGYYGAALGLCFMSLVIFIGFFRNKN
ncbi:MAG: hypothetical protein BWK80_12465 [Desulfobacteraceae bacterium IS3]|nr:MAG: hypothetical protein BWK80_12465 [Desulfobacteraceae bacterium IS3]